MCLLCFEVENARSLSAPNSWFTNSRDCFEQRSLQTRTTGTCAVGQKGVGSLWRRQQRLRLSVYYRQRLPTPAAGRCKPALSRLAANGKTVPPYCQLQNEAK